MAVPLPTMTNPAPLTLQPGAPPSCVRELLTRSAYHG